MRKLTDRLLAGDTMPDRFWCFGDAGDADSSGEEGQGHPGLSDSSASNTQGMAGPSTGPTGDSGSGGFDDDNMDPSFSPPTPSYGFGNISMPDFGNISMPDFNANKAAQRGLGLLASTVIGGIPGLAIGAAIANAPLGSLAGEPQGHPGLSDSSAANTRGMAGGGVSGPSSSPGGTDQNHREMGQQSLFAPPASLLNPTQPYAPPPMPMRGAPQQGYWQGNQFVIPPYGLLG